MNSDLKDNYLDSQMPDENGAGAADQVLREEDVDEEMFIFPDRAKADGAEEKKVLEAP